MKIAIIGHGNVGGALAKGWAKSGHEIFIGVRKSNDKKALELHKADNTIKIMPLPEAIKTAEVILVATPPQVTTSLAKDWGELHGKVIIDATNSIKDKPEPFETAYHAFASLCKAEVVKAFNTTGFENMSDPVYGKTTADMFIAGDSLVAKKVAKQLAKNLGFENVYDFGKVDKVKALEHLAFAWINLAILQGEGRQMAFKIMKR